MVVHFGVRLYSVWIDTVVGLRIFLNGTMKRKERVLGVYMLSRLRRLFDESIRIAASHKAHLLAEL